MIEKFAAVRGPGLSELLDLNHTSKSMILVSLVLPKLASVAGGKVGRTSESGHWPCGYLGTALLVSPKT